MLRPQRAEQFDPAGVCTVHLVQRCVRRAFLAGVNQATGKDYSFRKEWIRRRMEALASADRSIGEQTTRVYRQILGSTFQMPADRG